MTGKPGCGGKRKYNIDDNFFDVIDTESKAYILGFICADGYLIKQSLSQSRGVGIDLNERDYNLLVQIKNAMCFSGPIKNTTHGMIRISPTSAKLYETLLSYGVTRHKSNDLQPLIINISKNLQNHFFRGYFDGDGSWTLEDVACTSKVGKKYSYIRMRPHLRGTVDFIKWLTEMSPVKFYYCVNKTGIAYLSRKVDVEILGNWMYQDASIYLQRKYERFRQYHVGATVDDESA